MERPAWLNEEADQGCGFWRRHYDVAVHLEEACTDALLEMLERQFADEQTAHRPPSGSGVIGFSLVDQ
jgi:hypothetical protein